MSMSGADFPMMGFSGTVGPRKVGATLKASDLGTMNVGNTDQKRGS